MIRTYSRHGVRQLHRRGSLGEEPRRSRKRQVRWKVENMSLTGSEEKSSPR